eukprot:gene7488-634_t
MGNQQSVRTHAKSLVRVREQVSKLQDSIAQLKGVGTQMTTAATAKTLGKVMASTTKTMQAMNKATNPHKTHQQMQAFAKENEKMNMTTEMMDDAMDNAIDTDETEAETDSLVNQVLDEISINIAVLDEIGIDIAASAPLAGRTRLAQQKQAKAEAKSIAEKEMGALNAMLANINRQQQAEAESDLMADDEKEMNELKARLANINT